MKKLKNAFLYLLSIKMPSSPKPARVLPIILEPLKIIISTICLIFAIFPAVFIFFGLNEVLRLFVKVYLRFKFGFRNKVRLVEDGKDGLNCHLKSAYVRLLLEYNLPFDSKQFETLFMENIFSDLSSSNKYQWKLRQIIIKQCGYFCWKEDTCFNLANHIRSITSLLTPKDDGDQMITEQFLLQCIESLPENLGEVQPQWEIIYFPNIENKRFGIVFNFHQGYCDGVALTAMLAERLSSVHPFPYIMNPMTFKVPVMTRMAFYAKSYVYLSWNLLRGLYKRDKSNVRRQPIDEGIPEYCHVARTNLSFETLKSIRRIVHVPTSAILIYVYAQSLKVILGRNKAQRIPKEILCGYTVAKLPYTESLLNRIITIETKISLPDQKKAPEDLVKHLQELSQDLSTSFEDGFVGSDFSLPGKLPSWLFESLGRHWAAEAASRWFLNSNIPFAKEKVEIAEATPAAISLWPSLCRIYPYYLLGSNITFGDTVCACFNAKASKLTMEQMKSLVKEIPIQLEILQKAIDDLPLEGGEDADENV